MDARRMKDGETRTAKAGGRVAAGFLVAFLAAVWLGLFAAAPPASVNYQGVLRDTAGQPVADGSYSMVFTFWDSPSGGTMLLGDTQGSVPVSGGLFSVALGTGTLSPGSESTLAGVFANHASVYLGVRVGSDAEMTPRIQVVAAPFAQNAHTLDGLGSGAFAASSHLHDASAITTGTLPVARGGTGLTAPGASGNLLTSDGSSWTSSPPPPITGAVVDRYNTTLLRYGSGTAGDPYKLALNLGNTNTWTAQQNFSHNVLFGAGASKIDAGGGMSLGVYPGALAHHLTIYQTQAKALFQSYGNAQGSLLRFRNTSSSQTALGTIDFEDGSTTVRGEISSLTDGSLKFSTYYPAALGERMRIAASGNVGINATPDGAARLYLVASPYCRTYLGYNEKGVDAQGNTAGGYFKHYGTNDEAYLGYSGYGIQATGVQAGGYFYYNNAYQNWAKLATHEYGIDACGTSAGGHFANYNSSAYASVAGSTYKINGSGTMSFIQNHPAQKDRVIVYAAPEGDEVATYTRGTARLISGVASVRLGETFQWVTNPDVGLTAYLTPKGDCNGLYVESVSTTEMVVREVNGGTSDAVFDYLVYGLRIGFEESSIVQEKQQESFIPSFKEHRERYARYPELRAYNALQRFLGMDSSVHGESAGINFSRAAALRGAIHEYDPATDPPVEKLFGYVNDAPAQAGQAGQAARPSGPSAPPSSPAPYQPQALQQPEKQSPEAVPGAQAVALKPSLPCFPTAETVEPGDVLVLDAGRDGFVQPCMAEADPLVVGVAGGPAEECANAPDSADASMAPRVPLATSGVALCKVDTGYGPIRRGDLLTASPTPGHAMLASSARPGTILGKALEPLETGVGKIQVLLTLK